MKKLLLSGLAVSVLGVAVALSQPASRPAPAEGELQIQVEDRNPWTSLRLNNNPDEFQFAIVSDRTGGHREKVFARAVEQLNLLQPEFVLSVGDLIEGYTKDQEKIRSQWKELQSYTAKLQMPFFYVPGNHDIANPDMAKAWGEKFGRTYFHFVYRGVLFLVLNSDDPAEAGSDTVGLSETQIKWAKQVLADNANVRWTIVAYHKPLWRSNIEKNGWGEVERALAGRKYTVFVGHVHKYQKFVRNGMNYYQLATTGGDSRMRGVRYGEFDHIVWVTMKKDGPVMANILLDGVLPEDAVPIETSEPGSVRDRKPTHPVTGTVFIDGTAAAGATISFYAPAADAKGKPRFVGDAAIEGDGSFTASAYAAFDGLPTGPYLITAAYDGRYSPPGDRKDWVPAAYRNAETTPLRAEVKAGKNAFEFQIRSTAPPAEKPVGK